MRFDFLRGTKVTIWGLGILGRGIGTVRFFAKHGARVLVTDLKPRQELTHIIRKLPKGVKFVLGRHRIRDMQDADFVIKNPAARWDSRWALYARENGVPILTDAALFFAGLPRGVKVIGVTGTKGKTTTCRLIYEMIRKAHKAHIIGVPGTSFLGLLARLRPGDIVVAELSSFDLEGLGLLRKSPAVSVITNIARDHLNRYSDFGSYIAAKANIFRFQDRNGVLFINGGDAILRKIARSAPGKVVRFGGRSPLISPAPYNLFESYTGPAGYGASLAGTHNIANVNAAVAAARLFGIGRLEAERAVRSFRQLAGHFELIRKYRRIMFINDTCATNPMAAKNAIRAARQIYPGQNIVMILGGADKDLNFKELLPDIKLIRGAVVLWGSAASKIVKILRIAKVENIVLARSLRSAVADSIKILTKTGSGGLVLFSPAAASFGMFRNEFDRGAAFNRIVKTF